MTGVRLAQFLLLTGAVDRIRAVGRRAGPPATVWQAMRRPPQRVANTRRFTLADLWESFAVHRAAFWGALALTLVAASLSWLMQRPPAEAQIRVAVQAADGLAADQAIGAAAQALYRADLRLAAVDRVGWGLVFPDLLSLSPGAHEEALRRLAEAQTVWLAEGGRELLVRTRHDDPAVAIALDRALVAVLLARQAPRPAAAAPAPVAASRARPLDVLQPLRARLVTDLDAADHRAAMLSEQLTDTVHDMVSVLRVTSAQTADAKPPAADLMDQGRVLLGELQLKRLQLASKYQDDFPAVAALDGEIAKLRGFLSGEQRHGPPPPRGAANPLADTLATERRRLEAELEEQNTLRTSLRAQLGHLDQEIAIAAHAPPPPAPAPAVVAPVLMAGGPTLIEVADPRLIAVPSILLVGLLGALMLQWAMLRRRQVIVTPAEAELVLGLPVMRCFDGNGRALPRSGPG